MRPSVKFFQKPDRLIIGDGITVTHDRHVFGYLALWNSRLINGRSKEITPPRGCDYVKWSNTNKTVADDDGVETIIRTGVIAMYGGHSVADGFERTQDAYGDIRNRFANVVYGEDDKGVWFSGVVCDHVSESEIDLAISSGISGHWEPTERFQNVQLVGSVLVNIPGFVQSVPHRICASGGFVSVPQSRKNSMKKFRRNDKVQSMRLDRDAIMASGRVQAEISGILLLLNSETEDGRLIQNIVWDKLPLPLFYQEYQSDGHHKSLIVGKITDIVINGDTVNYTGLIDADVNGGYAAQGVGSLGVLGVSIDGSVTGEVMYEYDETEDDMWAEPSRIVFTEMKILGATLLGIPAFHETVGQTVKDFVDVDETETPEPVEDVEPSVEPVEEVTETETEETEPVEETAGAKKVHVLGRTFNILQNKTDKRV